MNISIKLLNSNNDIYKKILNGLLPQVNKYMSAAVKEVESNLSAIIQLRGFKVTGQKCQYLLPTMNNLSGRW